MGLGKCYYYLYKAFEKWQFTTSFTDRLPGNIRDTGLFENFHNSKLLALAFLAISLLGAKGRKDKKMDYRTAMAYLITGLLLFFCSALALIPKMDVFIQAIIYVAILSIGFMLMLSGGTLLTRIIKDRLR
ncbi:YWFCY domain-containing protein [Pedobacter sp. KBS0701]|uniref:YWFCY domain-containing protein n=1 Tax=Pedobacter sp. KBS0701 TaxID=2578106 RepID=UPI001FF02B85|nr:YWFCY domain-containing protein [Pedobacter sp. KBS0701]